MGMGYDANYAWVAKEEWLESLQLDGWAELQSFINRYGDYVVYHAYRWGGISVLLYDYEPQTEEQKEMYEEYQKTGDSTALKAECEADAKALRAAIKRLDVDFYYKTKLHLDLGYHDPDAGDRYDDVNDLFYVVHGVEFMTLPGAQQHKAGNISKAYWVTYG